VPSPPRYDQRTLYSLEPRVSPPPLPSLPLAQLPTPLVPLRRLSQAFGIELWCKRDDLTGLGLSGNKVRKLGFLLRQAVEQGCDTVITTGGLQSNHCRATAVAARQLGLRPVLLLRGALPEVPDANLLLDRLLGAELHLCTPEVYRNHRDERMAELAEQVRARGGRPYIIPEGGSNGLGALGYVQAAAELRTQQPHDFEGSWVAVGSGGTVAGLALGFAGSGEQVVGVPVCDDRAWFAPRVCAIAAEATALGAPALPPEGQGWSLLDGYQGPAYAVAEPAVWETIALVARTEGLLLDPVYTGKAMHALRCEAAAGRLRGRWLFWHTGGAFGLFGRGAELPA
jgi:D-cysteine desulfhydrase